MNTFNSKIPAGALHEKWDNYKANAKLVNPNNKRKFKIIVVGTGLAGASAAATLAELGYQVDAFTFHDSPRRAHSIAAQGGINAAKNYQGDGDSVNRLFTDTIKGAEGAILHIAAEGSPLPSPGTAVEITIDWDRRHKLMRMHTALHLLSVVFPFPVTGGSVGEDKGRLDFDMPEIPDQAPWTPRLYRRWQPAGEYNRKQGGAASGIARICCGKHGGREAFPPMPGPGRSGLTAWVSPARRVFLIQPIGGSPKVWTMTVP